MKDHVTTHRKTLYTALPFFAADGKDGNGLKLENKLLGSFDLKSYISMKLVANSVWEV